MLRPLKLSMPVSSEHWQLHTIAKCCQHMSVIWSRRLLLAWSPPVSPVMPKVPPANRGRDLTVRNTNDLFSWQIKDRNGAFLAGKAFELLSVEQNIQNRYIPLISTDLPFISFFLPFSVPSGMVEQQQPICCASALSKQTAPLWMQMSREIFFAWASRDQKITTLLLEFLAVSIQCYETRAMWTSSQDTCQSNRISRWFHSLGPTSQQGEAYLNLFGSKGPQIWWAVANWWSIQHPNFDLRHARPEQDPIGSNRIQ